MLNIKVLDGSVLGIIALATIFHQLIAGLDGDVNCLRLLRETVGSASQHRFKIFLNVMRVKRRLIYHPQYCHPGAGRDPSWCCVRVARLGLRLAPALA